MAYMEWRPALEVGHAKIDAEHRTLVDALNRLHAAMKLGKGREEIEGILLFLKDYTANHFKGEESMMMAHRYPGTQAHCAIHADLMKQVGDLIRNYQGGKQVLTSAILDFLEDWLVKHIMGEDKALGEFLKRKESVA